MPNKSLVSGLLNIDKPKGLTSHDVVAKVRWLSNQRKVGHTGTLDPLATGVLLVCLGQATRLIEYSVTVQKQYRAVIRFGITTDTLDAEGKTITRTDVSHLTAETIKKKLPLFLGEIEQTPPIFSAIKKDGQPLYKRARAGETVEVTPRTVTIYDLTWVVWRPPDLTLDITCSSGTYIRALAHDLGQAVQTGAYLADLSRTANGPWLLEHTVSLDTLEQDVQADRANLQKYLHPLDSIITHLPKIVLGSTDTEYIKYGRRIQLDINPPAPTSDVIRAYAVTGEFLAILKSVDGQENIWKPKKVFN